VGAAAILAVTLWVHGSSASRSKADQAHSKEPSIQTVIPAVQVVQKITKPDPAAPSKILAKSNPNGDDDSFQEVVVRHPNQPAVRTLHKDGVKRRVVVD
jgi:hypothetical protein